MSIYHRSAAISLLLIPPVNIYAAELASLIITATRTAQDDTLAAVTVLTRHDIEQQQAQSVSELLQGVAGVRFVNNGGLGKTTTMLMRGTESDHVLVLIDGIKIGSATLGLTAFENLPIEQIERIEVVRGPRSSLYGSEAIGGVIQIFTRKGGGGLQPFFSLGSGNQQTYSASAGIRGGGTHGWFNLSVNSLGTEGFNTCRGTTDAGCFTLEPDLDGYHNLAGSLRAGYRFENGAEVDLHALRSVADSNYDGSFVNESETVQQIFGATLDFAVSPYWQLSLALGRSQDNADNFKDGTFQTHFDNERNTFSWQNDFSLSASQLATLGFDYQDDKVASTTEYVKTSRDNQGIFGQYLTTVGRHELELSLRRDDNAQFGTHTTGGIAWGMTLRERLRLTASYGTGFKAPTFNDLYYPGFGNLTLQPETSTSLELGLSDKTVLGTWSLHAYQTRIHDLIGYDAVNLSSGNVDEALIFGLESVLITPIQNWTLTSQLTWLDTENQSPGANHGKALPRRAEYSLRMDIDRHVQQWNMGATLNTEGKRYDDLSNSRELSAYVTLNLRGEYVFSKAWRLQAKVSNLFDRDYETAAFYNQSGRGWFITIRYQP